jgi:hypothetical protein
MPRTIVTCSMPNCQKPVQYKLGAPWSDGSVRELKNYGLSCAAHVGELFRAAETRRAQYQPARGETIDKIHIYHYESGQLDREHPRLVELEESCRSGGPGLGDVQPDR